ncbi:MAG: hypothetical protein GEU83_14995 [Pseudonocardiaceae bacterium]|nr:hypothetical protein [Pseudonocardiaceae bacterium]
MRPARTSEIALDAGPAHAGQPHRGHLRPLRSHRATLPGRCVDNPARPDADTARRAREATLWRHLRVDLALAIPAPLVGLFWAYLDGGGVGSWTGATAVAAVVAMWTGAYRGSDPS